MCQAAALDSRADIRHSVPVVNPGRVQSSSAETGERSRYRSSLRQAQAAATRASVLAAAADLFTRRGYLPTTMRQIAEAAGVSVETVHAQGTKQALLLACVDRVLGGEDEVPIAELPAIVDALDRGSQREVVEGFITAMTEVSARAGALIVAFEDAAAADPDTAELWRQAEGRRREDYRRFVAALAAIGPLREGVDVESATDGLWAIVTPRLGQHLIALGWPTEQSAAWISQAVSALLLPADDRTTS